MARVRSKDYATLCKKLGVTQSMGAVGTSADNALAESFNATMKREVLQDAACWSDNRLFTDEGVEGCGASVPG